MKSLTGEDDAQLKVRFTAEFVIVSDSLLMADRAIL